MEGCLKIPVNDLYRFSYDQMSKFASVCPFHFGFKKSHFNCALPSIGLFQTIMPKIKGLEFVFFSSSLGVPDSLRLCSGLLCNY